MGEEGVVSMSGDRYHPSSQREPKNDMAIWVVEEGVFLSRN